MHYKDIIIMILMALLALFVGYMWSKATAIVEAGGMETPIIRQTEVKEISFRLGLKIHDPVNDMVETSPFGGRRSPFTGKWTMHYGIDVKSATDDRRVFAVSAGEIVLRKSNHSVYGGIVDILHDGSELSRYAHLDVINVKVGDIVREGAVIGEYGTSGRTTGPHLHFEIIQGWNRWLSKNMNQIKTEKIMYVETFTDVSLTWNMNLKKLDLIIK